MSARLSVNLVSKSFGACVIVRDVRFAVNAGEVVAILGASGCGKTTLLRIIAGLDQDYQGEVVIHNDNAHRNGVVGVVYQEPRLMPWLNVEENIAFAQAAPQRGAESGHAGAGRDPSFQPNSHDPRHRESAGARHPATALASGTTTSDKLYANTNPSIDGLLQEVLLEDTRQYWPKQLSGGMAQRVSIARALVREPDVLLMDEPFSSLDVITRRSLYALTRAVTARHQTATVIVTHDPDEAVHLADRVLVLAKSTNSAASIVRDFRPSRDAAQKHREVEAIIAALDNSSEKRAA